MTIDHAPSSTRVPQEVLAARAYLLRVAEPPCPPLAEFVSAHGPLAAADRIRTGHIPESLRTSVRPERARAAAHQAEFDIGTAHAAGARLLVPEDPDWPTEAFPTGSPNAAPGRVAPLALWVRGPGRLRSLSDRSLAVVGSRAATGYGTHNAAVIASALAAADVTVISGAAFGIDAAAHRGALAAGGLTLAVLGCGPDRVYPAAHESLLERIAASGLVVTEYPPGTVPARHRFLVRNRLIAGLAQLGTVVVEASVRSGSMSMAAEAEVLGRPLMAIPGPTTSAASAGCHVLIRRGAELIPGPDHLVARVQELDRARRDNSSARAFPAPALG